MMRTLSLLINGYIYIYIIIYIIYIYYIILYIYGFTIQLFSIVGDIYNIDIRRDMPTNIPVNPINFMATPSNSQLLACNMEVAGATWKWRPRGPLEFATLIMDDRMDRSGKLM